MACLVRAVAVTAEMSVLAPVTGSLMSQNTNETQARGWECKINIDIVNISIAISIILCVCNIYVCII